MEDLFSGAGAQWTDWASAVAPLAQVKCWFPQARRRWGFSGVTPGSRRPEERL
jgi:hypothetical protein